MDVLILIERETVIALVVVAGMGGIAFGWGISETMKYNAARGAWREWPPPQRQGRHRRPEEPATRIAAPLGSRAQEAAQGQESRLRALLADYPHASGVMANTDDLRAVLAEVDQLRERVAQLNENLDLLDEHTPNPEERA